MLRILSFSLVMSLASLMIVLVAPITLTEDGPRVGSSPYRKQLDALHLKAEKGMHPSAPEWKQIEELSQRNNAWFDEVQSRNLPSGSLSALAVWKMKSSKLAPGLMLFWGVCFYFFIRKKSHISTISVLVFPVMLTAFQLLSLLSLLLISLAVCGVYFYLSVKK